MSNQVVELYRSDRLARLARRRKIVKYMLWFLAVAALGTCVYLTAHANTRNYDRMLLACICISVGTAWLIIYLGIFTVRGGRQLLEHAANMYAGERSAVTGVVTVEKRKIRIQNSITIRKVRVETEDGPVTLSVHIDRAEQLKRAGKRLTLYSVHGYVVAYQQAEGGKDREVF